MNKSKKITLDHVRKALRIIKKGGKKYGRTIVKYDQENYCGTACCLWGHAALVAKRCTVREITKDADGIVYSDLVRQRWAWRDGKSKLKKELARLMKNGTTKIEQFEKAFRFHKNAGRGRCK